MALRNLNMFRTSLTLAHIATLIAFSCLCGWLLGSVKLITWIEGWAPMQFNTAVGFCLCTLSFLALFSNHKKISQILGYIVVLFAAVSFLDNWADIGSQNWFYQDHWYTINTPKPGLMSIFTSISLMCNGTFAILMGRSNVEFLELYGHGMLTIGMGLISLVTGLIVAASIPTNASVFTMMSLPTFATQACFKISKYIYLRQICGKA